MSQIGSRRTTRWCDGEPDEVDEEPIFNKDLPMTEEALQQLMGDRGARVTVSLDQKDNSFGKGFGAFASVTLSCHQESESIALAGEHALRLATVLVSEAWERSRDLFDSTHPTE